jgi:hypothetical protein
LNWEREEKVCKMRARYWSLDFQERKTSCGNQMERFLGSVLGFFSVW